MRKGYYLTGLAFLILVSLLIYGIAEPATAQKKADWFSKAVAKVESRFIPAEAKPGQTITWQVSLHLKEGYYTYPLRQADKAAASMINELVFLPSTSVIFVGEARDPVKYKSKTEPILGIQELRYLPDVVVYERTAIVSPKAAPGSTRVATTLQLNICNENNCFPTRAITSEASLTITDGAPVPVDPKYQAEVQKSLESQ